MHFSRTIMLAAIAAVALFAQPAKDAEAGQRWHMQFGWPFAGDYYAPRHRRYYYEREYYDPYYYYYDDEAYYDPYYDPYYDEPPPRRKKRAQRYYEDDQFYDEPPPPRKKKKLSTAKAYPDASVEKPAPKKKPPQTASTAPTTKPQQAASTAPTTKPQQTASTAPASKPAPKVGKETASGAVTCDKAKTIIGDFGFAGITPTDCEGSELGFKAQRDGKSFSIKVSSLSGELTEVKRQ